MPEVQPSDEQIQRHEMEKLPDTLEIAVQLVQQMEALSSRAMKAAAEVHTVNSGLNSRAQV